MREFIIQAREYGIRVAIGNWLIGFTKWYLGAKRIQITYWKSKGSKLETVKCCDQPNHYHIRASQIKTTGETK